MAAKSLDKILCGAALLVLLSSLGWTFSQGGKAKATPRSALETGPLVPYAPAALGELQVNTQLWFPPLAQSGGAEWVYEVFTPPEIYYDAASKRFSVTPPNSVVVVPVKVQEPPFGVELIQVKQDAFRLQLVGYTGKEGNYRGTFENALSGKTILGQAGRKIADLGLTIRSFVVKQNRTKQTTGMDLIETEAVAEVVDDKTGEVFNLTNKSRLTKGTPIALLKTEGSAEPIQHKAGDKFTVGDASFTITSVSFEPNEVVVVKEAPALSQPLTKTLSVATPVSTPAPAAPVSTPAPAAPASSSPFAL